MARPTRVAGGRPKVARAENGEVATRPHPPPAEPADGMTAFGRRVVAGMKAVNAAMRDGGMAEVERQFTVRRVRNPFPRVPADPAAVAAVRAAVGASQAAFAALLGVSAGTVRAWEQGTNPPSGMAARFLAEIRADPEYWKRKLAASAR